MGEMPWAEIPWAEMCAYRFGKNSMTFVDTDTHRYTYRCIQKDIYIYIYKKCLKEALLTEALTLP